MAKYGMILIILATLLAGCSKLSKENYDRLKVGMAYGEVVSIFGKPDTCSDTLVAKGCTWGDDDRNVTIGFLDDKVIFYKSKNID